MTPLGQSTPSWTRDAKVSVYAPLASAAKCDVCIVGAGITGLTCAYYLLKAGHQVIVLDDNDIAGGETMRTTAHLSYVLGRHYLDLEKIHGKDRTRLIAGSHASAIDEIESIVTAENIDCDFRRLDGYLFLSPDGNEKDLINEQKSLHRAGQRDVEFAAKTPYINAPALKFPGQGQFHILKYIQGLAKTVVKLGGKIHTGTHVTDFKGGKKCTVETESGWSVTSGALIIATNAPIKDNVQLYGKQAAYRTFVIAATMKKDAMKNVLLWDTQSPYHYIRIQEGETEDLLIVGGEDHRTGQANDAETRFSNLERFARSHFPFIGRTMYRWSGQVMESYDGIAMIGRMPMQHKNIFVCTGDSGNGMTHGTIAGMLLSDLITGKKNDWEELYHPSRIRMRAGDDLMKENMNTASAAVCGWVATGSKKDVKSGSGAVYGLGTRKIALYIDPQGKRHEFSAICPHRKCIVRWNECEKTFDCPCHGSRFGCDGRPLNGPVMSGLTKILS